jgi:hypothetical protein
MVFSIKNFVKIWNLATKSFVIVFADKVVIGANFSLIYYNEIQNISNKADWNNNKERWEAMII